MSGGIDGDLSGTTEARPDVPLKKKEKPYISPSQISLYTKCGEAWRRRYIKKEILPPGVAALRGTSVHRASEHNFKQKIETHTDLKKKDLVDLAAATFDHQLKKEDVLLNRDEEAIGRLKVIGAAKDETVDLARVYIDESAPLYQPAGVELKTRIELPDATHDLLCILDLTTIDDEIIEYKTGKKWTEDRAHNEGQITFQAMSFRAIKGYDAKKIVVENLIPSKKSTRNSITTTRDATDYQVMINRINAVLDGINKGVYPPADPTLGWWCSEKWCGFWNTCDFVKKRRA